MKEQFGYWVEYDLKAESEISRGTFGVVYLARRLSRPSSRLAVKVFFQSVSSAIVLQEMLFARLFKGMEQFL